MPQIVGWASSRLPRRSAHSPVSRHHVAHTPHLSPPALGHTWPASVPLAPPRRRSTLSLLLHECTAIAPDGAGKTYRPSTSDRYRYHADLSTAAGSAVAPADRRRVPLPPNRYAPAGHSLPSESHHGRFRARRNLKPASSPD